MFKLSWPLLAVAVVMSSLCSFARAASEEDGLWQTDFEAAKTKAKAEKKLLLVDFTGSDWCIWCKRLKAEVFDKEEFQTAAPKQFVLVVLDFPNKKKLPAELKAQNEKLRDHYKIRGYPTVLVLDPEGEVVAHTGYKPGGPEKYVEQLTGFVDAYAAIVKLKDQLPKAEGIEKAKILDQLVEADEKLGNDSDEMTAWSKEIVALDPDNKAGLRNKHEFRMLTAQSKKASEAHKFAEAKEALEKAVALDGIGEDQKAEAAHGIKQLTSVVEAEETVNKLKSELEKSEGLDRAKLLDKLIDAQTKLISAEIRLVPVLPIAAIQQIDKWTHEVITLDSENKAGLKTKYEFRAKMMQFARQMQNKNVEKARATLDDIAALPGLTDDQKEKIEQARGRLPKEQEKEKEKNAQADK